MTPKLPAFEVNCIPMNLAVKGLIQQHKHQLQNQTTTKSMEVLKRSYRGRIPSVWNRLESRMFEGPNSRLVSLLKKTTEGTYWLRSCMIATIFPTHCSHTVFFPRNILAIYHPLGVYNVKKKRKEKSLRAIFQYDNQLTDICASNEQHLTYKSAID